jgi:hypothetical protein
MVTFVVYTKAATVASKRPYEHYLFTRVMTMAAFLLAYTIVTQTYL